MNKPYFFTYLKESMALNLPTQLKADELGLDLKTDEKSIKDISDMFRDFKDFKKDNNRKQKLEKFKKFKKERASILKKYNLKIENGEIVSRNKPDNQLSLFNNIEKSNNLNEFTKEIKDKINLLTKGIEENESIYRKNLRFVLKRFFSVNRKIPKRYIYLPVTNSLNISQVEKINNNSHLDMLLKIKNGLFANLSQEDEMVINYLKKYGYQLTTKQYIKNICVNANGKEVPIDKELTNISMINIDQKKKALEKQRDPKIIEKINLEILKSEDYEDKYLKTIKQVKNDTNILHNSVIILTWVPRLILTQSTNTIWTSCMRYSFDSDDSHGVNVQYVPSGMRDGMFIAWLVSLDDRYVAKPIARTLLKPFVNKNEEDVFYWPSKVYTSGGQANIIKMFTKTLTDYCFFKQKDVIKRNDIDFYLKTNVYSDEEDKIKIYSADKINEIIKNNNNNDYEKIYDLLIKSKDIDKRHLAKIINRKLLNSGFQRNYQIHVCGEVIKWASKLKQLNMIKKIFDVLSAKAKIQLLEHVIDKDRLHNIFENVNDFKYFINLYDNDLFVKNTLADITNDFIYLHNNYEHNFFEYIKTMIKHFGKSIYHNKIMSAKKLLETDNKASEIIGLLKELDLGLNFIDVNLYKIYDNNVKLFFKLLDIDNKMTTTTDKQILDLINHILMLPADNKLEMLKMFLDKTDFKIKDNELTYNIKVLNIHASLTKYKEFEYFYQKLLEKNIDMKKSIVDSYSRTKILIAEILINLIRLNKKYAFDFYKSLMAFISGHINDMNFFYHILDEFFAKNIDIDLIMDLLINIPELQNKDSFSQDNLVAYLKQLKDKNKAKEICKLVIERFVDNETENPFHSYSLLSFYVAVSEDQELFDKFIGDKKIEMFKILNLFFYGYIDLKDIKSLNDFKKAISFFVKNKNKIDNTWDKIDFQKFIKSTLSIKSVSGLKTIEKFYILKNMMDAGLIDKNKYIEFHEGLIKDIERDERDKNQIVYFIMHIGFVEIIEPSIFKEIILIFNKKLKCDFITNEKSNLVYVKIFTEENLKNITDNMNVKTFYDVLDDESKDQFIFLIMKSYSYVDKIENFYTKIIEFFNIKNKLNDMINNFIENEKNYRNDYVKKIIIDVARNFNEFDKHVEKYQILNYLIKTKYFIYLNNLLNKEDFNDDKIKKELADSLSNDDDKIYISSILINIFDEKSILSLTQKS
jgi:hypothetical protein